MPATTSCTPCCVDTQTVNVPGIEGNPGTDGTNGTNAYTFTTADFTVPAIGATVIVFVDDSGWMVVGQPIFIFGPSNWTVSSITNSTTVVLTFLGLAGNVAPGATISSGAGVSPGGTQGTLSNLSVYGSGTVYTLTATPALLTLGTTTPSLTITAAGTYLLYATVRYDLAAWKSTLMTLTTKLRRTNNTAADVTATSTGYAIVDTSAAAVTSTLAVFDLPVVQYVTTNSNDIIQLWGSLSAVASVSGTVTAVEASIVAVKIA